MRFDRKGWRPRSREAVQFLCTASKYTNRNNLISIGLGGGSCCFGLRNPRGPKIAIQRGICRVKDQVAIVAFAQVALDFALD
jgi:hypothetical protein